MAQVRLNNRLAAAFLGLATLGFLASAGTASAATVYTWNLANGSSCSQIVGNGTACLQDGSSKVTNGNVYQFTTTSNSTPYLTASAYTSSTNTSMGSATFIGEYSGYGLGAENASPPQHAVDNVGGYDFVVFKVPTSNSATITLSPFGTTEWMNATVFYGTPKGALAGITGVTGFSNVSVSSLIAANGFSTYSTDYTSASSSNATINLSTSGSFTYIIVAAALTEQSNVHGDTGDYFKINSLTSDPVPEPASLAVLAAGLAGLGFLRRRRKAAPVA